MDRYFFITIVIILLLFPFTLAQECGVSPEQKTYFDSQTQKATANINSKIDAQVTRLEQDWKNQIDTTKTEVLDQFYYIINDALKNIAIGLAGMIVITLAIFKVIDLKITTTKNLKKYEEELRELIDGQKKASDEINKRKLELQEYQKMLMERERQFKMLGQQSGLGLPQPQMPPIPQFQSSPPSKGFSFKLLLLRVGIIALVLIFIGLGVGLYLYANGTFPALLNITG